MDIHSTRECNLWNLQSVARFLQAPAAELIAYYEELLADTKLLTEFNIRLKAVHDRFKFFKGIFRRDSISSLDWFAFERVLLYVLVRHLRPTLCLETGVYYGGNTAFLLAALARNGAGSLVSIDLADRLIQEKTHTERHPLVGDSESYGQELSPGFIVPSYLRSRWQLMEGDSHRVIPRLDGPFDFFVHDSDHSFNFIQTELRLVRAKLVPSAVIVADDIDWSNGFFSFCSAEQLHPLLLTDNGKDNLRVRMGIVKLDHSNNSIPQITGCAA